MKQSNVRRSAKFNSTSRIKTLLTCILFWVLFVLATAAYGPLVAMLPPAWKPLMFGALGTIVAFLLTFLFVKWHGRSLADVGLVWQQATLARFFKGLFVGVGIFTVILLALLVLTNFKLQLNPAPFSALALVGYSAYFLISLMEEVSFRGLPFKLLQEGLGIRTTQVVVAIVFALYHVVAGQDVAGSFLGPGIYSLVFGLAAVWSRGIAMPFGIHFGLNIAQTLTGMKGTSGAIWIVEEAGRGTNRSLLSPAVVGLAMQIVVLVATVILMEVYIRRKRNHP